VSPQGKAKRPVHGFVDADARCNQHFGGRIAVVAHLKRRMGIQQIDAVVRRPGEAERLA
jgi:hypothetical protein